MRMISTLPQLQPLSLGPSQICFLLMPSQPSDFLHEVVTVLL